MTNTLISVYYFFQANSKGCPQVPDCCHDRSGTTLRKVLLIKISFEKYTKIP